MFLLFDGNMRSFTPRRLGVQDDKVRLRASGSWGEAGVFATRGGFVAALIYKTVCDDPSGTKRLQYTEDLSKCQDVFGILFNSRVGLKLSEVGIEVKLTLAGQR